MTVHQTLEAGQQRESALIRSEDLFIADNVIEILHNDTVYTLRITRQGKLLLTK